MLTSRSVVDPIYYRARILPSGEHIGAHLDRETFHDGRVEYIVSVRHDAGLTVWRHETQLGATANLERALEGAFVREG